MRIAIIDPFYDMSHRIWAEGLCKFCSHDIDIYALDSIYWKWKMTSGALTLVKKLNQSSKEYDIIIATDMLDLSLFKSALSDLNNHKPIILYFHENQITYPWSQTDPDIALKRDHHYGWINFTSAVLSDFICFNSTYHKNSFLAALPEFLNRFPDAGLQEHILDIKDKCSILPIGLDLSSKFEMVKGEKTTILWNHRWESDKNPELFYRALIHLKKHGFEFKLIICGKEYRSRPVAFDQIKEDFKDDIIHWGFVEDRSMYWTLLSQSDVALTTSNQDFFGISVVEAIHAGCIPLLPNRLAYPEHIPQSFHKDLLYNSEEDLFIKLEKLMNYQISMNSLQYYIKKYDWTHMMDQYELLFDHITKS